MKVAIEKHLYKRLDEGTTKGAKAGIVAANILTGTLDDAEVRKAFGQFVGDGDVTVREQLHHLERHRGNQGG